MRIKSNTTRVAECLSEWEADYGVFFTGKHRTALEVRVQRIVREAEQVAHQIGVNKGRAMERKNAKARAVTSDNAFLSVGALDSEKSVGTLGTERGNGSVSQPAPVAPR